MRFTETALAGAYIVEPEKKTDRRGYFARSWCVREFRAHGLETRLVQCNLSGNTTAGTLRGMHYQLAPHAETKLVRCNRGAIYDVIIDLRPASGTFLSWFGVTLTPDSGRMLYVPAGFAHGFQTLEPDSEVFYQMSECYAPEAARGLRWDDPLFQITWPLPVSVISDKDRSYGNSSADQLRREALAS